LNVTSRIAVIAYSMIAMTAAWGVLAFGSPYPWAYQPLMAAAALTGAAGLASSSSPWRRFIALDVSLLLVGAAVACQLVTLPVDVLQRISPGTLSAVRQIDLGSGSIPLGPHPTSIYPAKTQLALAFFVAFALLTLGTARLVSRRGPFGLAYMITWLAVLVALLGVVTKPAVSGKLYGFWTPQHVGSPVGPFVNRNHFAGWMDMTFPVAAGLLAARLTTHRRLKSGLRNRLLWLSSAEGCKMLLLTMSIALMALSVVMSLSRSGIVALLVATMSMLALLRRGMGRSHSYSAVGIALIAVLVAAFAWSGVDSILGRFHQADWGGLNHRRGAWTDALRVAGMFPVAGIGMNTYDTAMLLFQEYDTVQHYSAAHNDYLQVAAEGGMLVSLPVAVTLLTFVWTAARRLRQDVGQASYWIRAGAVAGLIAMACQETVEFSLQMPGNAAMCAVLVGIAVHCSAPGQVRLRGAAS
jgi:hypothetical protein